MQGAMARGSQREEPVLGLCPDDGGGVAIAYVEAGGVGFRLVGAFPTGRGMVGLRGWRSGPRAPVF